MKWRETGRLTVPESCMDKIISVLIRCVQKRKEYEIYYPQYSHMPSFTGGSYVEEKDTDAPSQSDTLSFVEGNLKFDFCIGMAQGESGAYLIISKKEE